ncbi:unnamed protein product [Caenorhabditis sp. 36 PRJEB53466]|nr:unnamed protein product [Caenorhabditis sp. 36 PRJEB53466]
MDNSSIFRSPQRFKREPHNVKEAETIFSVATTSAARYVSDSSSENTTRLDESLTDLIKYVSDMDKAARLTLKNRLLQEFLSYTPAILNASTTSIVTRSKFYRLLFNIAHHNIPLRRFMAGELRLLGSVFSCLKMSLREQLGPQNMIDILRLLQVLSYEKNVPLEHWANELISFLMGEVIREPEPEWMPYCIAILCNLASASKSACKRIKISTSYKKFNRQLMKLLQHEARIIVVSSLVLIGYLDEKVRDMVYCAENVHDTFMCTFNVLTIGDDDCMMTRQIAADLLKRLVVSESSTTPQVPTLASTGKNVLNYGFFLGSIQQTARLLITLDPRTEESSKVYDLLLAFCSLQALRSPVCHSIIRCSPTESQLTTPLMAIAETASLSIEDHINGEVPLKALKMLSYLFKEIIEPHERLLPDIPISQIADLIASCVRTSIDLDSENLLKDERIIPFLAFAISFGDKETVQHAFLTYSHCAQVPAFPSHMLAEMVASFNQMTNPNTNLIVRVLWNQMRSSSLKDAKTSELFAAYERKIQVLQARERDLENFVRAKDDALAQNSKNTAESYLLSCSALETKLSLSNSEKIQLKAELENATVRAEREAQSNQSEMSKLNAHLAESVARVEQFLNENKEVKRLFEENLVECEALKEHVNQAESQLANKKYDLEKALAQASNAEQRITAKEMELASAEKHLKMYEGRLSEKERECAKLETEACGLRIELEKERQELLKLKKLREAMLTLASSNI